jgi:hypothetical protein
MRQKIGTTSKVRKNFDFDPRYVETIARLQDVCGLKTETSVIEESLVLLAWAAGEVAKGNKIGAYDDRKEPPVLREITSTALEKARYWTPRNTYALAAAV